MDDDVCRFLSTLARLGGSAVPAQLPACDRQQDKARQRAKRAGFAEFVRGDGLCRWKITDAGRTALDSQ